MHIEENEVWAVIPAYNEVDRIQGTIHALKGVSLIDRILVVDDGSTDDTALISAQMGVEVLALAANHGKAYAMGQGYEMAKGKILLFLDADLGSSACEAGKLIEPLLQGNADVTVARFPMTPGQGGFGMVKALARNGVKLLTGTDFSSVLSGQRGCLRSFLHPKNFFYHGFGIETGMTVDLLHQGARMTEVEVSMHHRTTGRDLRGFVHRFRQFRDILWVLALQSFRMSMKRVGVLFYRRMLK